MGLLTQRIYNFETQLRGTPITKLVGDLFASCFCGDGEVNPAAAQAQKLGGERARTILDSVSGSEFQRKIPSETHTHMYVPFDRSVDILGLH